jgi:uncharacterized protein YutD
MRDGGFHLKVAFAKGKRREEKVRKGKRGEDVFDECLLGECYANVCDDFNYVVGIMKYGDRVL